MSCDTCFMGHLWCRMWWWYSFFLKFGLSKCQCQVKLGQIRSYFKIQNFLTGSCLYCLVLPQDSKKNVIYFYVRQLKAQKTAFLIECWDKTGQAGNVFTRKFCFWKFDLIWHSLTWHWPLLGPNSEMNVTIKFCVKKDPWSMCHTTLMQHLGLMTLFDLTLTFT